MSIPPPATSLDSVTTTGKPTSRMAPTGAGLRSSTQICSPSTRTREAIERRRRCNDAMIGAASDIRLCSTLTAVKTTVDGGRGAGGEARVILRYGVGGGCGVAAFTGVFAGVYAQIT